VGLIFNLLRLRPVVKLIAAMTDAAWSRDWWKLAAHQQL
jgi:hypothetical protein